MDSKPLCAIWVVTYNQRNFIAETIENILQQKTTFPFKIFIGDDYSTDGTREICIAYKNQFPELIEVILNPVNRMQQNSINVFKACAGSGAKYMAMCEGDDYWTDPFKLQKQVDFLEQHAGFAICFHNAKIVFENEPGKFSFSNPPDQPEVSNFEDIVKGEFIYTPTCTFRIEDFKKFPEKYYAHINNYTLDLHNAQFGSIKYLNEVMCVYRRHNGGIWSMVAREKTLVSQMPTYKFYVGYFHKKYKKHFLSHLKNMTAELIGIKLQKNDFKDFWKYYMDYVFYNITNRKEFKNMALFFLKGSKGKIKSLFSTND